MLLFSKLFIMCLGFSLAVFFPRLIFFYFFALYLLSDKQCLFLMLSPFSPQICLSILGSAFIYQHFYSPSLRDQSILCFFHQSFFLSFSFINLLSFSFPASLKRVVSYVCLFYFFYLFEFDSLFLSLNFYHPPPPLTPFLKFPANC